MKPLRLRLQAFGPFANSIEISFDRVFDGGLFLLHGRTGAGKTSILDGLCFALFGRPSTPEREKDLRALRSDSASATCQTEVELVFTVGTVGYRVRRTPTQDVPKKRGEGTTEIKGVSTLEKWQGTVSELRQQPTFDSENWLPLASNTKEVDLKVEALLGMNEKQFRQIVILPQGRFREFLSSSSTERQLILERLFQTDRFSRFQGWIAQRAKNIEAEWIRSSTEESSRLQALGLKDRNELGSALEGYLSSLADLRARLSDANKMSELWRRRQLQAEHRDELHAQRTRLLESQHRLSISKTIVETERKRLDLFRRFAHCFQLEDRQQQLTKQLGQARDSLSQLKMEHLISMEREAQLREKLHSLEHQRPSIEDLEAERLKLLEIYRELQEISKMETRLSSSAKEIAGIDEQLLEKEKAATATRLDLERLLHLLPTIDKLTTRKESREFEESLLALHSIEARFHQGEAARLAASLKKGAPCPVCGSTEHPDVARSVADASTTRDAVEVEQKRHSLVALRIQKDQATRAERIKALLPADELPRPIKRFEDSAADGVSTANFSETADLAARMTQQLSDYDRSIQSLLLAKAPLRALLNEIELAKDALLHEIPADRRDVKEVVAKGQELAQKKLTLEEELRTLRDAISRIQRENSNRAGLIEGKTEEILRIESDLLDIGSQIQSVDFTGREQAENLSPDVVATIEQQVQTYDASTQELLGKLSSVTESLDRIDEQEALDTVKKHAAHAFSEEQQLTRECAAAAETARQLSELQALSLRRDSERNSLDQQYRIAQKMNLLLTGDRSVNALSVPLSRYVLQARFEACLEMANHRLFNMSRGQYQLRRPTLSRLLTHSQGLNLSVEDAHTGRERPADSLSGGESFMAALALALGLSDVVQANLGGIRLDSLFIDEGFGTLDSESLDLAIRTLVDLQAGGRMVGIISHVQELQAQVQHRLEVRKSPDSTTATWS